MSIPAPIAATFQPSATSSLSDVASWVLSHRQDLVLKAQRRRFGVPCETELYAYIAATELLLELRAERDARVQRQLDLVQDLESKTTSLLARVTELETELHGLLYRLGAPK